MSARERHETVPFRVILRMGSFRFAMVGVLVLGVVGAITGLN